MVRFIKGENRQQTQLLPECLEDYVSEDNPVRLADVFIPEWDLGTRGFAGPASTGRPEVDVWFLQAAPDRTERLSETRPGRLIIP